jgi:hypothetical protein
LNPLKFAIWHALEAKVLVMPHSKLDTLCPSIAVEWDWLAAEYISRNCLSFRFRWYVIAKKMKFKLNRWLNNAKRRPTSIFQA